MLYYAGSFSNRTATPTASVLIPLDYGYPMQIFPGATFRFGLCQKVTPSVYLRVDLMSVPSLRKDNASAYAIHVWGQVRPSQIMHSMLPLSVKAKKCVLWGQVRPSQMMHSMLPLSVKAKKCVLWSQVRPSQMMHSMLPLSVKAKKCVLWGQVRPSQMMHSMLLLSVTAKKCVLMHLARLQADVPA